MIATLEEHAYKRIRTMVLRGELPPGAPLREATLGKEMGVSRMPVRLAIRQLEREGLVVQVPGIGSYVKKPELRDLREAAELRQAMERAATGLAAERMSATQLFELKGVCEEIRTVARAILDTGKAAMESPLLERHNAADEKFHVLILSASGNRQMLKMVSDAKLIERFCTVDYTVTRNLPTYLARHFREHYQIFQAIRDRKPELAARRMEEHLEAAKQRLISLFADNAPEADEPGAGDDFGISWATTGKPVSARGRSIEMTTRGTSRRRAADESSQTGQANQTQEDAR